MSHSRNSTTTNKLSNTLFNPNHSKHHQIQLQALSIIMLLLILSPNNQLTHIGPPRTGSRGPTRTSPLTAHQAPWFVHRGKHATTQPLCFIEKTLEGGRSQDELTPWSDPCYARGLKGSWTHKETKYMVTWRWRIDRILGGIRIKRNLFRP